MPTAKLNGIDIYYEEHGSGPAIILTHGLGDSASLWAPLAEALGDSYRLIAWDMRGHYRTEAPAELSEYTQDIVVEDLRALCDHLGLEKAVHGGHSLGGYTALRFHEKYPERVSALVLHAAGPGYRNEEASQAWTDRLAGIAEKQEARFGLDDRVSAKELRTGAPQLGEISQHVVHGITNVERGVMAHPSFTDATKINVPALVIVGENDKAYVASSGYFEAKLPQGKKIVIKDAGHPAALEQPEAVNAAIHEFLDGVDLG
ncbi:MAG: alpha/beta hydrolase [Chloroflexi bacterium]|nr:alpha/beta hydrolase [Chloroflexota bacterium]MCI0890877.1 alpha/beta hydrolase [Chloroflexota bacterium]